MDRFEEQAIVLGTVDYGESDRLVTLFTLEHGKLSAFAAGARKSKRRFAGALEPATLLTVRWVERRGDTVRLDSVDVRNTFHRIREDLSLIARSSYCLELCRELVRDREPHPQLFALLSGYLQALDSQQLGPTSLLAFELEALAHAGLMPRFSPCALCGGETGPRPRFDPSHGGVVCGGCASRSPLGTVVNAEVVNALATLQRGVKEKMGPDLRRQSRELLNLFIAHHLGRKLKSVDFMRQVGLD